MADLHHFDATAHSLDQLEYTAPKDFDSGRVLINYVTSVIRFTTNLFHNSLAMCTTCIKYTEKIKKSCSSTYTE